MKVEFSQTAILPFLEEEDFEQMGIETRRFLVENEQLKRCVARLESYLVVHAWAGWKLH